MASSSRSSADPMHPMQSQSIPKLTGASGNGSPTRPISHHLPKCKLYEVRYTRNVAALEDKIVQRATAMVLNAIYEEDFLGISYGFRPGRGQHDALDALVVGIGSTKVNWILDSDIRSFSDHAC